MFGLGADVGKGIFEGTETEVLFNKDCGAGRLPHPETKIAIKNTAISFFTPILSYPILSYPILSYPIGTAGITSFFILFSLVGLELPKFFFDYWTWSLISVERNL
ncbi:hypothetical protein [Candidatus Endomicrobiellum agilis]|uniref:hypothetical protein n=1 Tax=Candidatus Endomicrobiellum agilis TaxID=3238957 RepID=UPI003580C7F6|nr:hypothetical protein [Endomicrobium sp.]